MEEIANHIACPRLFNSPFESGIRAIILLNAYYPKALSLSALLLFDHLIVHTQDVNGPDSLHVDIPYRGGELLVRRSVIETGVSYMRRLNLANLVIEDRGIYYQATDEALPFVGLLRTPYNQKLKQRAAWLAANFEEVDDDTVEKVMSEKLSKWHSEFYPNT
jgi:hypothetical protein